MITTIAPELNFAQRKLLTRFPQLLKAASSLPKRILQAHRKVKHRIARRVVHLVRLDASQLGEVHPLRHHQYAVLKRRMKTDCCLRAVDAAQK